MEMAAHKTCKGMIVTAVTTVPTFWYYTELAPAERHNHHKDFIRRELNLNVVQILH
jgi:hypothetical protein